MENLTPAHLTPAQQRVLVDLMASGRPRPRFQPTLADELRSDLESALGPLNGVSPDQPMWVSKGALADVHTCEAYSQARGDWPGWTARTARGTVVHRALETMVGSREELAPLEVVDHAIARLATDDTRSSLAPWLAEASPLDLADLRAGANEVVAKFVECWPPLKAAWRPRTEVSLRQELGGGRVVLSGKVDLVLGLARGDEARSLIVDLKTGPPYPSHLDDLRFYALLQTLRVLRRRGRVQPSAVPGQPLLDERDVGLEAAETRAEVLQHAPLVRGATAQRRLLVGRGREIERRCDCGSSGSNWSYR